MQKIKMPNIKVLIKNKKFWKIFIPIILVLVVIGLALYAKFSVKPISVTTAKVTKGDIKQYYETTGTISSGAQDKYYLYEGVMVKEVKVKVGEKVKKGDLLATFDTASLTSIIKEKKEAVDIAQKNYNDAVADKEDILKRAEELDNRIESLKKQQAEVENSNGNGNGLTQDQADALRDYLDNNGNTQDPEAVQSALNAMQNSSQSIGSQIQMLETERAMVNTGQYDSVIKAYKQTLDAAKEDYNEALNEKKVLDEGWTASEDGKIGNVNIKSGEKYVYTPDESESNSLQSMLMSGSDNMSGSLASMLTQNSDTAKKGVGLVLDKYEGYQVSFSLGKYDAQIIKVGMPAILQYTDYEYEAEVDYMSPYASGGSDLSSMVSGMMGGGMGNSGGGSSNALLCTAKIKNPDDILIVGFDSKLSILTSEKMDVLTIPVESLVIDEGKKYVFLYDEASSTAVKKEVEVGISSDKFYEVISGLSENDTIIVNTAKLTDGAVVEVK